MHRFGRCRPHGEVEDLTAHAGYAIELLLQIVQYDIATISFLYLRRGPGDETKNLAVCLAGGAIFPGDQFDLRLSDGIKWRTRPARIGIQPAFTGKGESALHAGGVENDGFGLFEQGIFFLQ